MASTILIFNNGQDENDHLILLNGINFKQLKLTRYLYVSRERERIEQENKRHSNQLKIQCN